MSIDISGTPRQVLVLSASQKRSVIGLQICGEIFQLAIHAADNMASRMLTPFFSFDKALIVRRIERLSGGLRSLRTLDHR